jgi:P-type conjugative transfer protein TrbJ
MKRHHLSLVLGMSALWSVGANAFFCANCADVVQMAQNNIGQTQSYIEQVQQTINSLQSLEYQVQNLERLGDLEWGDVQSQLRNLNTIASRGQSVSYAMSDVTQRWNELFVGVDGYQSQSIESMNSVDAYKAQGDALRDTAQSSLALASQMSEYQVDDNQTLAQIQSHVRGAEGAMEIAQANAELLSQLSSQLQKLQTLMQAQIQMQATQIAAEADTVERQRVAQEKMLTQPLEVNPTDGKDWSQEWQSPSWSTP